MARVLGFARWGEVNAALPGLVGIAGLCIAASGRTYVGLGIALGALLAFANSTLLIGRIRLALSTDEPGPAMISMQAGMLVSFTIVALITVLTVLIARSMAVAMGISFFFTQTAELCIFFFDRRGATTGVRSTGSEA